MSNSNKQLQVKNFVYNGFSGRMYDGFAPYTAQFLEWTEDAGIAYCLCSDGKERYIPTFALVGFKYSDYPKQQQTGVMFGVPSES